MSASSPSPNIVCVSKSALINKTVQKKDVKKDHPAIKSSTTLLFLGWLF